MNTIFALLLAAFVTCKLAGFGAIASWSWLWVLSPLWLPLAAFVVIMFAAAFIDIISSILD